MAQLVKKKGKHPKVPLSRNLGCFQMKNAICHGEKFQSEGLEGLVSLSSLEGASFSPEGFFSFFPSLSELLP